MAIPLGVVDIVYAPRPVAARAELAVADGFEHIDVLVDVDPASLPLPVGCPTSFPKPRPGWCATPAPHAGPGVWERTVGWFRAAPGALLEPWAGHRGRVCALLETSGLSAPRYGPRQRIQPIAER